MAWSFKSIFNVAAILFLGAVAVAWADVKLRIYLKDGSLQSGNLVTETPTSFVILTRDGRAELPRDQIMFINGKTLKQWEERPDKLFQTEIIPSDVPNPAYVNQKASLSPAITPVKPVKSVSAPAIRSGASAAASSQNDSTPALNGASSVSVAQGTAMSKSVSASSVVPMAQGSEGAESVAAPFAARARSVSSRKVQAASAQSIAPNSTPASAPTSKSVSAPTVPLIQDPMVSSSIGAPSVAPVLQRFGASKAASVPSAASMAQGSEVPESVVAPSAPPARSAALGKAKPVSAQSIAPNAASTSAPTAIRPIHLHPNAAPSLTPTPSIKSSPATPSSPVDVPVSLPRKRVERRWARTATGASQSIVVSAAAPSFPSAMPPGPFVRARAADWHFAQAKSFLSTGETGRALQELHVAALLDRSNTEAVRLLGRLYMEADVPEKAAKYFSNPILRKDEEVKKWSVQLTQQAEARERTGYIWMGGAIAGSLTWIPLLSWMRRRSRRARRRIITADTIPDSALTETPVEEETLLTPILSATARGDAGQRDVIKEVLERFGKSVPSPMATPVEPPMRIFIPQPPPQKSLEIVMPDAASVASPPAPALPTSEPATAFNSPAQERESYEAGSVESFQATSPVGPSYEEVLQLASHVDEILGRGNALAVEGDLGGARREYRTVLMLQPLCSEAYQGLGYLCFMQGEWELALAHYRKALAIDPQSADAHYGVGRALYETNRHPEAIPELQAALTLDPTFDDARETLTVLGQPA